MARFLLVIQQDPGFYIATNFTANGANEFVTNVSSSLFAVSATAAQNTHIEPATYPWDGISFVLCIY